MEMLKHKKFTCFMQHAIEVSTGKLGAGRMQFERLVEMLLVESLAGGLLVVTRENNFSGLMKLSTCLFNSVFLSKIDNASYVSNW